MNQRNANHLQAETAIHRRSIRSDHPEVLADIYQDDINIAVWQRTISPKLLQASEHILNLKSSFRFSASLAPQDTFDHLFDALGANVEAELISTDVAEIVSMFCLLFELDQVGLRLTTLDSAMCPKFHVDRVPCRLVSTYNGIATEWLSHQDVDRRKLGAGSQGRADDKSGLYQDHSDIHRLNCGDIALLKGEAWLGNEGGGLVHRSPGLSNEKKRLLLTLDF